MLIYRGQSCFPTRAKNTFYQGILISFISLWFKAKNVTYYFKNGRFSASSNPNQSIKLC